MVVIFKTLPKNQTTITAVMLGQKINVGHYGLVLPATNQRLYFILKLSLSQRPRGSK